MEWLIISLFAASILLFGVSFLGRDKDKEMKAELDQLTLQMVGDVYDLRKRIHYLEEELLAATPTSFQKNKKSSSHAELVSEAHALFQQNRNVEEIAAAMELQVDEVKHLLSNSH
ncbi:hypothetical protein [Bacillus piscicola]|uniref:hypothetical protein n=1 Tax=Bacillus piscicola TaxID=1632684 RepID=UPI001F08B350|nr:hypothetical protein [Bacillus piscicola]